MTGSQPLAALRAPLQFTDSTGCRLWLEQLTLTNVKLTQQVLAGQLATLREAQLSPLQRFGILEALRDIVEFVQGESCKRYAGRALPLDAAALSAWRGVQALWEQASRNYGLCLAACREGEPTIAPHAALVTGRCLQLTYQAMADHYRCYRQLPAQMWRSAHELYAFAEAQGFASVPLAAAPDQAIPAASCRAIYAGILLADLANPYSLTARQFALVERWLARWAPLVGLAAQPPDDEAIPLLAVDPNRGEGVLLDPEGAPRPGVRHLELGELSRALRRTISLLKQGQTPAQLGLGEDARQPGCENLLMLLYVHWCRAGLARGEARTASEDAVHICLGLGAAHQQLSGGRGARPPGEITSREKQDLDNYGYITRTTATAGPEAGDAPIEQWQSANRSGSGFLCVQRPPSVSSRVFLNQALAVRRVGSRHFSVGMVQWLRLEEDGHLFCGVRLFPGSPQPVSVLPCNFNPPGSGGYERALLLPEVPAAGTPATLILPVGWFQSGHFVELHTERKQVAKLLNLLERGNDFDRGTIVII